MIPNAHKAHNPRLHGRTPSAASLLLTAQIMALRDQRGLTFDQIAARLAHDFDIHISRAAVWQRYQRGKR